MSRNSRGVVDFDDDDDNDDDDDELIVIGDESMNMLGDE
jgi:hypothetical protein